MTCPSSATIPSHAAGPAGPAEPGAGRRRPDELTPSFASTLDSVAAKAVRPPPTKPRPRAEHPVGAPQQRVGEAVAGRAAARPTGHGSEPATEPNSDDAPVPVQPELPPATVPPLTADLLGVLGVSTAAVPTADPAAPAGDTVDAWSQPAPTAVTEATPGLPGDGLVPGNSVPDGTVTAGPAADGLAVAAHPAAPGHAAGNGGADGRSDLATTTSPVQPGPAADPTSRPTATSVTPSTPSPGPTSVSPAAPPGGPQTDATANAATPNPAEVGAAALLTGTGGHGTPGRDGRPAASRPGITPVDAVRPPAAAEASLTPLLDALGTPATNATTSVTGSPSGAQPTSTPAALPSHLAELARTARISADGTARLTVRLDPPELGAVTLTLHSRGGEVELSLRADTQAGASALATQQARVREVLAGHGFDLARFTVVGSSSASGTDGNPDFSRQYDDARRGDGEMSSTGRDAQRGSEPDHDSGRAAGGRPSGRAGSGLLADGPSTTGRRGSAPAGNEGTWL